MLVTWCTYNHRYYTIIYCSWLTLAYKFTTQKIAIQLYLCILELLRCIVCHYYQLYHKSHQNYCNFQSIRYAYLELENNKNSKYMQIGVYIYVVCLVTIVIMHVIVFQMFSCVVWNWTWCEVTWQTGHG